MSSELPLFFSTRAHLLVCTGPRCSQRGSARVFSEVWSALERQRLAYYTSGGSIRLTESGCLGCCSNGPAMAAYYGRSGGLAEAWYVGVDAERIIAVARALHEDRELPGEGRFGPR